MATKKELIDAFKESIGTASQKSGVVETPNEKSIYNKKANNMKTNNTISAGVKKVASAQPSQKTVSNNRKHSHLVKAKKVKDDEYYTRYEDVVCELEHYAPFLTGKVLYCN